MACLTSCRKEVGAGPRRYCSQKSLVSEAVAIEEVEEAGVRRRERGLRFTFTASILLSQGVAYWQTVTETERPLCERGPRAAGGRHTGLPLLYLSLLTGGAANRPPLPTLGWPCPLSQPRPKEPPGRPL